MLSTQVQGESTSLFHSRDVQAGRRDITVYSMFYALFQALGEMPATYVDGIASEVIDFAIDDNPNWSWSGSGIHDNAGMHMIQLSWKNRESLFTFWNLDRFTMLENYSKSRIYIF